MEQDKFSLPALEDVIKQLESQSDLPKDLKLDESVYIPDLRETIHSLALLARANYENAVFHPSISLLYKIKEKLLNLPI